MHKKSWYDIDIYTRHIVQSRNPNIQMLCVSPSSMGATTIVGEAEQWCYIPAWNKNVLVHFELIKLWVDIRIVPVYTLWDRLLA